jgi:hypothetical protein
MGGDHSQRARSLLDTLLRHFAPDSAQQHTLHRGAVATPAG